MSKKTDKRATKPRAPEAAAKQPAAINSVGRKPVNPPGESKSFRVSSPETQPSPLPVSMSKQPIAPTGVRTILSKPPPPPKPPETAAGIEKAPMLKTPKTVNVAFVLQAAQAKQVSLCGDFNQWSPDATPMRPQDEDHWTTTLALPPGRYEYKFVADGQWLNDPMARENVPNLHGSLNSVIEVRA